MSGRTVIDEADALLELARVSQDTAEWPVWSTTARIVVTDPAALAPAFSLVLEQLAAVDLAASRFRDDSEVTNLHRAQGCPQPVSPLLAELVRAGLAAARVTGGDVDPTLGSQMQVIGYDRDFAELDTGPAGLGLLSTTHLSGRRFRSVAVALPGSTPGTPDARRASSWRGVVLNGTMLTLPADVVLDLGATAKAFTADRCARLIAERTGSGVLVSLGGDIATAGPGPAQGWQILVSDGEDQPQTSIALPSGGAVATSSTIRRTWAHDGGRAHHILDPGTGRPADPVWRTVTVAAETCMAANIFSTAAVVRGRAASGWLDRSGVSARLVTADGSVVVVGGWRAEAR